MPKAVKKLKCRHCKKTWTPRAKNPVRCPNKACQKRDYLK